ncbi:hypothetical protein [Pueribacillus sp. YX66]|uniref:hypothetical protein n=1 Tax=Pueribacillus sp. YX66 TaxID=3229242 RepID=UPI00358CFB2F
MDKFKLEIRGNRREFLTLIIKGKYEMEKLLDLFLNNGKQVSISKLEQGLISSMKNQKDVNHKEEN